MEYARIKVSGSSAELTVCKPIVAGTIGGTVSFQFDESWDGLIKTLVWRGNGITVDDTTFSCIIPAEVVAFPGRLYVGVYGVKDNTATPTVWVDLGQIQPGADPSGDPATDPTLPVWAQIMQKMHIDDQSIGANAWSSKNTVDRLCPDLSESGPIVACEPLAGYPLTVQADEAAKVYRCGKNIIPPWTGSRSSTGMTFKGNGDGSITFTGTPTAQWSASCFIRIPQEILKGGKTYSCTPASGSDYTIAFRYKDADGNYCKTDKDATRNRITWNDSWSNLEIMIYCPNIQAYNETVWLQLELGEKATDYEPYVREEFAPGEPIAALDGVNTIWADSGDVTVTGKADPVAASRKQDERIKALEASLTALLEG